MLCRNPYQKGMHLYPCGQCMPCRFNRRRVWTHRLMLEAGLWKENAFITLTYSEKNLPMNSGGLGILVPKDLQDWLKRFRKAIAPSRVRFYACGEYGDDTFRPHYHVALFNYPSCAYGHSRYRTGISNCCPNCDLVRDTWGLGQVFVGRLETSSAQYVAGYVTKKMTSSDDPRLIGRPPEFARMSNRPGIGADAMEEVASTFLKLDLDETETDVPVSLRHGGRTLPLGRYLRRRLRLLIGREENAPQEVIDALKEELRPLYEATQDEQVSVLRSLRFKGAVTEMDAEKVRQIETRSKIHKKRGSL